jgi:hypothetical protein
MTAGCGAKTPDHPVDGHAPASTRPAAKQTCPDVDWQPTTPNIEQTSRELIGFGPTLLGVHTTWAGDGFTAETMAGGYVDDLTEPYDNLAVTGTLIVASGAEAEVMHGTLQGAPVLVVVWREPNQARPCDVRALVVQGADVATEGELLAGLR